MESVKKQSKYIKTSCTDTVHQKIHLHAMQSSSKVQQMMEPFIIAIAKNRNINELLRAVAIARNQDYDQFKDEISSLLNS